MGKTNSADQALIQYESGQALIPNQAMTDSGDHQTFSVTSKPWSGVAGKEALVIPDGLATGGVITPDGGVSDSVAIAALNCYLGGVFVPVSATTVSVTRGLATDTSCTTSITVTSAGEVAAVAGTDGPTQSEARGAAGGPPLIPTGSIEIGQVRLGSTTPAPVASDEIYQVIGTHQERYDFPIWDESPGTGEITFAAALPTSHTGAAAKGVSAQVYTPIFATIDPATDFTPPETSHSQSSNQVYGGTVGSSTSSLSQGSFTAFLKDGVTDAIARAKDQTLWFKFFPNRLKAPYMLVQGMLGIARKFPAGGSIEAACTISATSPAIDFEA